MVDFDGSYARVCLLSVYRQNLGEIRIILRYGLGYEPHTIWIHNRENIVVVLVHKALDLSRRSVVGKQIVSKVLSGHGRNPLASVDGSVEHNCWLATFTTTTPEVNSGDCSATRGGSSSHNLGLGWMSSNQVIEE